MTTIRKSLAITVKRQLILNSCSHSDGENCGASQTVQIIDLTQHQNVSKQDMTYFDDEKKIKYIPYVIEPSLGADRMVLAFLCSAYDEEEYRNRREAGCQYRASFPSGACTD